LSGKDLIKANHNDNLIDFTWRVFFKVQELRQSKTIVAFGEHPEDLRRVRKGGILAIPASIWRSSEAATLIQAGWWSGGFRQGDLGADTAKPTRGIASDDSFTALAPHALPTFDQGGFYLGPVDKPKFAQTVSLVRAHNDEGPFRSAAAATYPSDMCRVIAACFMKAWVKLESELKPTGGEQSFTFPPQPLVPPPEAHTSMVTTPYPSSSTCTVTVPSSSSSTSPLGPVQTEATTEAHTIAEPLSAPTVSLSATSSRAGLKHWNVLRVILKDKISKLKEATAQHNVIKPTSTTVLPDTTEGIERGRSIHPSKWDLIEGVDYTKEGHWGVGPPISTFKCAGVQGRPFHDGAGLCSPGRWPLSRRVLPAQAQWFTNSLDDWLQSWAGKDGEDALQALVYKIVGTKLAKSPFEGQLDKLKRQWSDYLTSKGVPTPAGAQRDGIDFKFLYRVSSFLGDPDSLSMLEGCEGFRLGVNCKLHRTTAVWPPKSKWPLPDYGEDPIHHLNGNYPSAGAHKDDLVKELEDQVKRGWALPLTLKQARERFGEISVAPLAVIVEKGGKLRTLFDASNRVQVNNRITVLDAEQMPTALDVQAAFTADLGLALPILSLVVDIEKAHQQVPTAEVDWGHVACAVVPMPATAAEQDSWPLYLKTVGTYGVSSASWNWSRIGSCFQRLCYYVAQLQFLFRFADDYMLLACSVGNIRFTRFILRFVMMCDLFGIPLKWSKTRGGLECDYVGN
jgi:hypothetical protein